MSGYLGFWSYKLRSLISLVALIIIGVTGASQAVAAPIECGQVNGLSYDNEMRFCLRSGIYVAAVGEITEATPARFAEFLREASAQGHIVHSVTFHSPGGNLLAGIVFGKIIRRLKIDTHVGEASNCASACALAFLGGWSRKVTHDGKIGNHQISHSVSDTGSIETTQELLAAIAEYHGEMNVSPLALTTAISKRKDQMYWYSPTERAEWGIVTKR